MFKVFKKWRLAAGLKDWISDKRSRAAEQLLSLDWAPRGDAERAWLLCAQQKWDEATALGAVSVKPLLNACRDSNTRDNAREAILKMGATATAEVTRWLSSQGDDLALECIDLLGEIGNEDAAAVIVEKLFAGREYNEACSKAIRRLGTQALDPLVAMLAGGVKFVPQTGREVDLTALRNTEALKAVMQLIANGDRSMPQILLEETGIAADAEGAKRLLERLKVTETVIAQVADLLVQIGPEAAAEVAPLLDDERPMIRDAAQSIMSKLDAK